MIFMQNLTRPKLTALLLACTFSLCSLVATSHLAATPAAANSAMPTFSVNYILENDFVTAGEAFFRLSKQADHYQLVLETKPTGMFRLTKKGRTREVAELPSLYPPFLSAKYKYINFGDRDRSYTSTLNRQSGEATIVRGGDSSNIAIEAGTVDRLSMTLAIMQQLRNDPDIANFSIDAVDNKGTKTFSFVSRGQTELTTDIGNLTTTRIDRQRTNSNRNTITWFAALGPKAIPVPVQIEQYKAGKLAMRLRIANFSSDN